MVTASPARDPCVSHLRIAASAAALFAFALVAFGAVVRINGAGMTCPDWPTCRGVWFPSLHDPVVYEWVHRLGAPILTALIAATFVAAWRARAAVPAALRGAWFALAMVVLQIAAGAVTIFTRNSPASVAVHLVVGFGTFITLATIAVLAASEPTQRAPAQVPAAIAPLAVLATAAAFVTVFAGGFMAAAHDGGACRGLPLCFGWTSALTMAERIHMDHRWAAYCTFALVAITFAATLRPRAPRDVMTAASVALALCVLQLALGALTVATGLNDVLRGLHEANGALLGAALVILSYYCLSRSPARETLANYFALTKPRVMSLLLFTTFATMIIAHGGMPSLAVILATLFGGALATGSAGAINMYWDRDIDAQMKRTAARPIPSGKVKPKHALVFGLALGAASFVELASFVNLLAAALAAVGILYYVVVYTIWLKRLTPQNIVIGGAAGSIPPLVGWAAATGHIGLTAALLFAIVFVWTPPHFWALALMAKKQYAQGGIPMLPVVRGDAETKRQIIVYSIALAALTLVAVPLHMMGLLYLVCAIALDAVFLYCALRVLKAGTPAAERALYSYSLLYLALLFVAMAADRVLGSHLV